MSQQITISTVALANLLQQNADRLLEQIQGVPMNVPYLYGSYYLLNMQEFARDYPLEAVEMLLVFRSEETYKRMTCEENRVYALAKEMTDALIHHLEETYEMLVWAPNRDSRVTQQYFLPGLARNGRGNSGGQVIVDRECEKFEIPLSSKYLREIGHFANTDRVLEQNGQVAQYPNGTDRLKEIIGYDELKEIRRGGRSQQK